MAAEGGGEAEERERQRTRYEDDLSAGSPDCPVSAADHRLPSSRPLPSPSSGTESLFQCETTACPAQKQPTTFPRLPCRPGQRGDILLTNGHAERKSVKGGRLAGLGTFPPLPSLPAQSTDVGLSLQHHHMIPRGRSPLGALEQEDGDGPALGCLAPDFCLHERRQ